MTEENGNEKEKIDFVKSILEHNNHLIGLADTKAGFIVTMSGVVLGLLFLLEKDLMIDFTRGGIISTSILLVVSAFFGFNVIRARLSKNPPQSAIYFQSIEKMTNADYIEYVKKMSEKDILEDYLNNISNISKIQKKKFNNLNWSLRFIIISLISLAITLVSYFIP